MKNIKTLLLVSCIATLLLSCETEKVEQQNTTADLSMQIGLTAKKQNPHKTLDNSLKGIYHGVVAHQSTQSRGKIWINLGNNTKYDAVMEMVDGEKLSFKASATLNNGIPTYTFNGAAGRFDVIMNDLNSPEVTNVTLNDESYFAYVIKSTSANRATSYTGTFNETGNAAFSGTWNILSNGIYGPNNYNGTQITDVMITFGNSMVVDSVMEAMPFQCFGVQAWIPIVDYANIAGEGILAFGQESNLNGDVDWDLGYTDGALYGIPAYTNGSFPTLNASSTKSGFGCPISSSGTFSWTSAANATVRNGEIYIDVAP